MTVRVMWKPLKGQDRKLPSVKVVYPYSEIEWNRFDTQICLGEYHQDSCSKTGEITKVGWPKWVGQLSKSVGQFAKSVGQLTKSFASKLDTFDMTILFVGVPLLAVILGIILICVCLKKRKREKKFKARNEILEAHIFHES